MFVILCNIECLILYNELLAKIANKKLIFVVSLQRKSKKIKKMQILAHFFFDFVYNRGESELKVIGRSQASYRRVKQKYALYEGYKNK